MGSSEEWGVEKATNVAESARDLAETLAARSEEEVSRIGFNRAAEINTDVYVRPEIKISNVGNSGGTYYQSQCNYLKSDHWAILTKR